MDMNDPRDHDLLIQLMTEFRLFREEVRENNKVMADLSLRLDKVEKRTDAVETTMRVLKWIGGFFVGIGTLVGIIVGIVQSLKH